MKKILAVVAFLMLALGSAATSWADITLASAGPSGVVARIIPSSSDLGLKKIHTCAFYMGTWFCRTGGSSWNAYYGDGSVLPDAGQAVFFPGQQAPFDFQVTNLDISALVGLQVYVCYGADTNECLTSSGHLAMIYTVPEPSVSTVLHYPETVIGTWTWSWPYFIDRNANGTFTPVKAENRTRYTLGVSPLFQFWIADKPLPDGKILVNAKDAVLLNRHLLYLDPTTKSLYEYDDSVWVWDPTCGWCHVPNPPGGNWIETQPFNPAHPNWTVYAQSGYGTFFATVDAAWILKLQSTTGVVTVITPNATFSGNGTWWTLGVYSN